MQNYSDLGTDLGNMENKFDKKKPLVPQIRNYEVLDKIKKELCETLKIKWSLIHGCYC